MTTYAALTDGTTTITFASPGTLGWYRIETGWAPRVAQLRRSQLGGRGPYEDVTEEIPVSIGGSNAAHMYANYQALELLIDKSNRWYRGDSASAVIFKYSPEGATISSTASPLQAATWGAGLELSGGIAGIPQSGSAVWTTNATMRFNRLGLWLHNTAAASSASGASTGSPVLIAIGSSAPYPSPTDITSFVTSGYAGYGGVATYFVVSDTNTSYAVVNVSASSGKFSQVAGSAASSAYGGSVCRYTPTDTLAYTTSDSATIAASHPRLHLFASIRNNSATTAFTIYGYVYDSQVGNPNIYTPYVTVSGSDISGVATPYWQYLGMINAQRVSGSVSIGVGFIASSAAGTIDIDCVAAFSADACAIVALGNSSTTPLLASGSVGVYHLALSKVSPSASMSGNTGVSFLRSDGWISTQSASLYATYLSTADFAVGSPVNYWSDTPQQFYAVRTTAYLTPV